MLVVGRPREGETDCHRLRRHHGRLARSGTSLHAVAYATKTGDQQMQELVDGARCRGEWHRRYDLAPAPDGAEDQIGAAGVEGEHDTRVFHTSSGPVSYTHLTLPTNREV